MSKDWRQYVELNAVMGDPGGVRRIQKKQHAADRRTYNTAMANAHLNFIESRHLHGPQRWFHKAAAVVRRLRAL